MSDQLMLFAEGFPVSASAQRAEGAESQQTCGPSSRESSMRYALKSPSPKMSKNCRFDALAPIFGPSDILPLNEILTLLQQGHRLREIAGGLLHTPTTKANFTAPSMQKWPSCRRYVEIFGDGKILPEQFEYLMGYPIGWTALDPSETPSSRKSSKS